LASHAWALALDLEDLRHSEIFLSDFRRSVRLGRSQRRSRLGSGRTEQSWREANQLLEKFDLLRLYYGEGGQPQWNNADQQSGAGQIKRKKKKEKSGGAAGAAAAATVLGSFLPFPPLRLFFFFFFPLYSSPPFLLLVFVLLVSVSVRADRGAGNVPRSHPP
jgi:hypothetical protein